MANGISGSPRKVSVAGVTFVVASDANVTKTPKVTNEAVRHSGGNMRKVTLMHGALESITIVATPSEIESLESVAEGLTDVTLSIEYADGSIYRGNGWINLDNYESEENRCDMSMTPRNGEWSLFAAS